MGDLRSQRTGDASAMSSWGRGGGADQESNLEAQNDEHLDALHTKLRTLRGVTTDIYNDSMGQNRLLDSTSNVFDSFKTQLANTTGRFTRSVQTGQGGGRMTLYIVGAFVALFLLYKVIF